MQINPGIPLHPGQVIDRRTYIPGGMMGLDPLLMNLVRYQTLWEKMSDEAKQIGVKRFGFAPAPVYIPPGQLGANWGQGDIFPNTPEALASGALGFATRKVGSVMARRHNRG